MFRKKMPGKHGQGRKKLTKEDKCRWCNCGLTEFNGVFICTKCDYAIPNDNTMEKVS